MQQPTDKQLNYIASLMGVRDNKFFSSAFAEIDRVTGAKQKKATAADASETIKSLLARKK